jgi:iron complex outermembrane receptor protein
VTNHIKFALLSTAGIASLSLGGQALAQSSDGISDDTSIIVTARRVEERLQDVPISIAAIDEKRLSQLNITNADSIAKFVPGLIANSRYSSEQTTFAIRGFTQELRTSSSVGTYFADVVAPRGGGVALSGGDGAGPAFLFDLQNVQVLKGPQGTLFGRNTTGGAVLFVPKKPTDKFEGYLEGSYGNYQMFRIQGVVNLPISENVRLRVGADRMTRDGYLKNISGIGPRAYADTDYIAARASLTIDVTPEIENYTVGTFMYTNHLPQAFQTIAGNPAAPGFGPFLGVQAQLSAARLEANPGRWDVDVALENPKAMTRQWQVINTTSWQISDSLKVRNIASYSEIKQDLRSNIFGSNFTLGPGTQLYTSLAFVQRGFDLNNQNNITEELQLQGNAFDSKLNWQAGLYYEKSSPGKLTGTAGPSNGSLCLSGGYEVVEDLRCRNILPTSPASINQSLTSLKFINMAAYGQATYAITDALKLTAGIRYTYDRTHGVSIGRLRTFPLSSTTFNPPNEPVCETGFPNPDCRIDSRTSSKEPTWTLNLAYNVTPDIMLYGGWTRGYRQGSANPPAAIGYQTFEPESIDAYEIGAKTSFRSGNVSGIFNIAGYYNNLSNQQLQFALTPKPGVLKSSRTSIINAGKSRIQGVEADAVINFGKLLRLNGAVNYLKTKLISREDPIFPDFNINPTTTVGEVLPYSPKWSANVGGTFTLPLDESMGRVELTALYRYQATFRVVASRNSPLSATPVKQVDLNLDWRDVMGAPIDASFFVSNLTKQFTFTENNALLASLGTDARRVGEPRMFGARLKVRFGED